MYMANMVWNSAMNTAESIRIVTEKDPFDRRATASRGSFIRMHITPRWSAMPISSFPETTYLERGIAFHCSPAQSEVRRAGRCDPSTHSSLPDRDVRPFQDVLIDIGRPARVAWLYHAGRRTALSRGAIPITSAITSAGRAWTARRVAWSLRVDQSRPGLV